jgi:5-oxoprolinase (ATP-hydrolysing) subunit C
MTCTLEVVEPGVANSVQDFGRFGYRAIGVPVSGAADPWLLAAANQLLDNRHDATGIEISLLGPRLRVVSGSARLALAGEVGGRVFRANGSVHEQPPWQSATVRAGDMLQVGGVAQGIAYLAVSGGVDVPPQLGSRSTYARARLGGIDGRPLARGDHLRCSAAAGKAWLEYRADGPLPIEEGPLRVVLGPQDDYFTRAALQTFLAEPYTVTRDADRMGMRLHGPLLRHRPAKGADIVSDGVVPGAIQVPANGQPIVLLADCQTVGGYPKIATVIRADLHRLAHLRPGQQLRFAGVTIDEARRAWRAQADRLAQWIAGIAAFRPAGVVDEAALYACNLVSGMVDVNAFARSGGIELPWERM